VSDSLPLLHTSRHKPSCLSLSSSSSSSSCDRNNHHRPLFL
jgi:hypothetical protein